MLLKEYVVEVWSSSLEFPPPPLSQELEEDRQILEDFPLGFGSNISLGFGLPHPQPLLAVNMFLNTGFLLEDIGKEGEICREEIENEICKCRSC